MKTPATTAIDGTEDVIDSRDIIERIGYLEGLDERDEEEAEELKGLQSFVEDMEGYLPDWKYGEVVIRDTYFMDYARELAEDIGAINRDATWPNNHIDWDAACEALKQDYTSAELFGHTYWGRS